MKALTLWQPWASLVAFEEKKVETRGWSTKYRGTLAIHAAAKEPTFLGASRHKPEFARLMIEISERHGWGEWYWPGARGLGVVVCTAELYAIEPVEKVRDDLTEQELTFGNYEDGRFAWFLRNVRRYSSPVPWKGNRMLWNLLGLEPPEKAA